LSLSAWLRDYVYISLGGNRGGTWFTLRNLMLTMLIGGLWHGAAWTFVIWGALHGTFLCLERGVRGLAERWNVAESGSLRALGWLVTLLGVCWAWVFFRAPTLQSALALTRAMLGASGKWAPDLVGNVDAGFVLLAAAGLVAAHWWSRERAPKDLFETIPGWAVAGGILSMLIALATMAGEDRAFIYFQF
jgi:D-alanyl-lipoteichoic acid acyltransferase DltB (MBOAT superfamily)